MQICTEATLSYQLAWLVPKPPAVGEDVERPEFSDTAAEKAAWWFLKK
jgi:hypothetical protein